MFNLSISNIAWDKENDEQAYSYMKQLGYCGLEIAPTRIIPHEPYDKMREFIKWYECSIEKRGFHISSVQSIWYGRTERLFGPENERNYLFNYTKKVIEFAELFGCKNIVFGCPRNRIIQNNDWDDIAIPFFKKLGEYAYEHNTVISIEANPAAYNTNFLNYTYEAIEFVERVESPSIKLNLDLGTILENGESLDCLKDKGHLINHVHISEPGLELIKKRIIHQQLRELLRALDYNNYVSIEMKNYSNLDSLNDVMEYVARVFI